MVSNLASSIRVPQFSVCFFSVLLHYFASIHFNKNHSFLTEDLKTSEVEKEERIYYTRATVLLVVWQGDIIRFIFLCVHLTRCLHSAHLHQTLAIQQLKSFIVLRKHFFFTLCDCSTNCLTCDQASLLFLSGRERNA